jgi:hypothetical protein
MSSETLPKDILQLIKPQQVRGYAIAKGWQRVPNVNGGIALFNHPGAEWDQLIVPMDESIDDYPKRLRDIVEILAQFESRPATQVLNDLLTTESDILRYRVASPATGRGSIPLTEGIRLLEGAKRSILAAACSVVNPIVHHPRMSRVEAQQLLNSCHLGQTERGSYAVSVSCPLRAVEQDQPQLPGSEPFTRRAVSTLMRSLSRVVTSIEADTVASIFEAQPNQPVLSVNLCEAILQMEPTGDDSHLDVKVSWATTLRPRDAIPTIVRIKHEYFPIIEDISRKLQPAQAPAASLFVGNVDNLGGEPGADGRMQGEAILSVMYEEQMQLVRVDLTPEYWLTAHAALGVHGIVKFRGILHRGTRVHRVTDISEFDRVQ